MISPKWASFIQAAAYKLQIKPYYSVEVHLQVFPSAVRAFCSSVKYYADMLLTKMVRQNAPRS